MSKLIIFVSIEGMGAKLGEGMWAIDLEPRCLTNWLSTLKLILNLCKARWVNKVQRIRYLMVDVSVAVKELEVFSKLRRRRRSILTNFARKSTSLLVLDLENVPVLILEQKIRNLSKNISNITWILFHYSETVQINHSNSLKLKFKISLLVFFEFEPKIAKFQHHSYL